MLGAILGEELATCLVLYIFLSKSPKETQIFSRNVLKTFRKGN
jgi:hypothetical protein